MKCRLLRPMHKSPVNPEEMRRFAAGKPIVFPAGTEIEHADAYRLVQIGVAEPIDAECHAAHGYTPEQLADAREKYEMVDCGIQPEDYDAYQAGILTGYQPNGDPIPGPNATAGDDDTEDDEDADE